MLAARKYQMEDRRHTVTRNQILDYIRGEGKGRVTNKLMVDALGYTQQSICWQLRRLCELGKLTKVSRGLYELAGE